MSHRPNPGPLRAGEQAPPPGDAAPRRPPLLPLAAMMAFSLPALGQEAAGADG
ncbi:MAG: hypothetical protein JNK22_05965, partial [Rhodocyclaceae bacterium]|nr:hypothetical protein [Rhodocyclaceae bacterium]